ncbi:DUF6449 domain-containing protein [Murimonas intestini]|uniref:DUF6449 domain-containing protein n=1 Tax=Murimonas intestini TaxID=1337051 RepID=UPI0011DCCA60|nr:DUF6449 domain-containing protein [Murimonas intestini]
MTSKISFFKLMKVEGRYKSWLPALICLVLFISLPVACLLKLDGMMSSVKEGYLELETVRKSFQAFVGFGNLGRIIVTAGCAVVSAFACFSYMNSKQKVDFYHSLPVNRQKLFLAEFLNGLFFYVVPCFVCTVICIIIGAINSLLTGQIFLIAMEAFLMQVLYYLVLYLTGILAAVLTGKIIVGILAAATFMCYGPMVVFLIVGLAEMSFHTLMSVGSEVTYDIMSYLSPVFLCLITEAKLAGGETSFFCIGWIILMIALLFLLCFWLYCRRASEAAGHSIAFPKIEKPLKFLLVVPCSLTAGLLLKMMSYGSIWFFVGIIFGGIILSALIEFIYHLDIREIFAHKILMAAAVLTSLLVACGFYFDWIGYDSYIPDEDEIVSMSVYNSSINGNFYYGDSYDIGSGNTDIRALQSLSVTNFEPVYELAQEGIARLKESGSAYYEGDTRFVSVRYELAGEKEVYRNYYVSLEALNHTMDELFKDVSFRSKFFPLLGRDNSEVRYLNLSSVTGYTDLELTSKQKEELLRTYKEELEGVTFETLRTEPALGSIGFTYESRGTQLQMAAAETYYGGISQFSENYPVYESFTGTVALLKEYGYPVDEQLNASDIESVTISCYDPEFIRSDGMKAECVLTSEDEISQIAPLLRDNMSQFPVASNSFANMDIMVYMKNGNTLSLGIKSEDVPEFVIKALEKEFR